jgi:hypothetical protein
MYDDIRNPFYEIKVEKLVTESGLPTNKNALINSETEDIVGFVSPNYDIVTNKTVADLFQEAVSHVGIKDVKNHLDATTKRWKQFIVLSDKMKYEITPSDHVSICLSIHNGYDARTAYGYSLMGYRWLCSNGMVMGKKELFSDSFTHYDGNVEKLRDSFELKFDFFKKNAELWSNWNNEYFDKGEFIKFIDFHKKPESGKAEKHEYLTPKIAQGLKESYYPLLEKQHLRENKWGSFNVLTYLSTHETKARKGSNVFSNRYNNINRLAGDFYGWVR